MHTLKIKQLSKSATLPTRSHPTDAGLDLYASEDVIVTQGTKIPTGIAVDIPPGYEGTVRPRSGMSTKTPLRVVLGTVDCGFNGEVQVIADYFVSFEEIKYSLNDDLIVPSEFPVYAGDKIAQLVISPIATPQVDVVDEFETESERGSNGFGSTGY